MDILTLIKQDHSKIENIFSQIESTKSREKLYSLFNQLYQELNIHSRAEELTFYPALREFEDTDDILEEAAEEHEEAEILLEEIKSLDPVSSEFKAKMQELKEAVLHHVQEEESSIFATVRECMDEQELKELGSEFQRAKTKVQPDVVSALER